MENHLSANYALANDLDASDTSTWNYNTTETYYMGFDPIGESSDDFKGGFDGYYYTVSGLYIYRPDYDSVGLFGYSGWESDYIRNVGLIDVNIFGGYRAGGLIGRADSPITSCFTTGTVAGNDSNSVVGGITAQSHGKTRYSGSMS